MVHDYKTDGGAYFKNQLVNFGHLLVSVYLVSVRLLPLVPRLRVCASSPSAKPWAIMSYNFHYVKMLQSSTCNSDLRNIRIICSKSKQISSAQSHPECDTGKQRDQLQEKQILKINIVTIVIGFMDTTANMTYDYWVGLVYDRNFKYL